MAENADFAYAISWGPKSWFKFTYDLKPNKNDFYFSLKFSEEQHTVYNSACLRLIFRSLIRKRVIDLFKAKNFNFLSCFTNHTDSVRNSTFSTHLINMISFKTYKMPWIKEPPNFHVILLEGKLVRKNSQCIILFVLARFSFIVQEMCNLTYLTRTFQTIALLQWTFRISEELNF